MSDSRVNTLAHIGRALQHRLKAMGVSDRQIAFAYNTYRLAVEDVTGIHFDDFGAWIGSVEREVGRLQNPYFPEGGQVEDDLTLAEVRAIEFLGKYGYPRPDTPEP